jgi:CRISPR-associated endoribonuclease Cas6
MRLKITFELENEVFPVQYRKNILSFIKNAFYNYDEKFYEKFYKENNNIQKPYSYAIFLDNPKFEGDKIILKSNVINMVFSVYDYANGINIYNAINQQRGVKFSMNQNSIKITNIYLQEEKNIIEEKIIVKMLSPIIVREHNQITGKDYYYSYKREGFLENLKINMKESLNIVDLSDELVEGFEIKEIESKKTVIPVYEQMIEATLGVFELRGDRNLLEFLYKSGIGSRRSLGFGLFEILS